MVAVLRRGKGHEVLFKAISQIQAAIPNARVKLVGAGEQESILRTLSLPYGDTVEFLGQRSDVPELLGAS
jgi:glycosyltransferase involved in cell wall biosynthesis